MREVDKLHWRDSGQGRAICNQQTEPFVFSRSIVTAIFRHLARTLQHEDTATSASAALAAVVEVTGIRYLSGFGATLPDGFVTLDDVFETNILAHNDPMKMPSGSRKAS